MKSRRLSSTCLGAALVFTMILIPAFRIFPVQAFPPTVSVIPSFISTAVGQNFSVDITVSTVADLYAWEFILRWNSTLLDSIGVVEGPFLKSGGGSTFFTYSINSTDGQMVVDCALLGMVHGVNGNGVLSKVTFFAKNLGECPLDILSASLVDSFENDISCQIVDGYWQAVPLHDVAVTRIEASPTVTIPGNAVNINVTIQNNGSSDEIFNVTVYANLTLIDFRQVSLGNGSSINVFFTWNTTGYSKGDYMIVASAGPVPEEIHTIDNTMSANGPITILTIGHDVAVTGIKPEKTVVGQGYPIKIMVRVCNYGIYSETSNVTVYLNASLIGNQPISLASGAKIDLLFVNGSSNMPKGNYLVSATVGVVPGEILTSDNTLVGGWIAVTIPGDLNGDGSVNIYDALILSSAFNSSPSSPNWNPNADINGDNAVDVFDAILLAGNFGKSNP